MIRSERPWKRAEETEKMADNSKIYWLEGLHEKKEPTNPQEEYQRCYSHSRLASRCRLVIHFRRPGTSPSEPWNLWTSPVYWNIRIRKSYPQRHPSHFSFTGIIPNCRRVWAEVSTQCIEGVFCVWQRCRVYKEIYFAIQFQFSSKRNWLRRESYFLVVKYTIH